MRADPEELLDHWFGVDLDDAYAVQARIARWFGGEVGFDEALRARFGEWPERALRGDFDAWRQAPRSMLALVICLDQLPRNLHRDHADAFGGDAAAMHAAQRAIEAGFDARLHPVEATFLYLPFEHAEDVAAQERCVDLFGRLCARAPEGLEAVFESNLEYARRHKAVIDRFGRFPHRNAALGRNSTPEEVRYLEEGGEDFSSKAKGQAEP